MFCYLKICEKWNQAVKPWTLISYLTNKCDGLLAHRMRITNVGLDDLTKRLLHPLRTPNGTTVLR